MRLELSESIAGSLAEPIHQAVAATNKAQFALLLSMMFEVRHGEVVTPAMAAEMAPEQGENYCGPTQLNQGLSQALASGQTASFALLHCLHAECGARSPLPAKTEGVPQEFPAAFDRRGRGGQLIQEIEKSKQQARGMR